MRCIHATVLAVGSLAAVAACTSSQPQTALPGGTVAPPPFAASVGDAKFGGRALDVLGEPVPLAEAWIEWRGQEIARMRCDGTGCFRFGGLPRGWVTLHGRGEKHSGRQLRLRLDGPAAEPEVELVLLDAGIVRGRVTDADGRPLAGARVVVMAMAPQPLAWAFETARDDIAVITDTEGRYVLQAPIGSNMIHALAPGHAPASREIQVPDAHTVDLSLEPKPQCLLRLRFTGASGELLDGLHFIWCADGGTWPAELGAYWPRTRHGEVIEFQGLPLDVGIRGLGAFTREADVRPAYFILPATADEREQCARVRPLPEVAEPTEMITGRLLDADHHPVAGARVDVQGDLHDPGLLEEQPYREAVHTYTGRDGRFTLRGAPCVPSRLLVTAPGIACATGLLDLTGGRDLVVGDLTSSIPTGVLQGTLQDAFAAPRCSVEVILSGCMAGSGALVWRSAFTDRSGRFRFRDVPAGTWLIQLGESPWNASQPIHQGLAMVDLAAGESKTVVGKPW
jgi:hypothetical protein